MDDKNKLTNETNTNTNSKSGGETIEDVVKKEIRPEKKN